MVKRAYCLVMLMMLAQPAAATQMVNLANSARAVASANCLAEDPACRDRDLSGRHTVALAAIDGQPMALGVEFLVDHAGWQPS